jgi:hypothetical protein
MIGRKYVGEGMPPGRPERSVVDVDVVLVVAVAD